MANPDPPAPAGQIIPLHPGQAETVECDQPERLSMAETCARLMALKVPYTRLTDFEGGQFGERADPVKDAIFTCAGGAGASILDRIEAASPVMFAVHRTVKSDSNRWIKARLLQLF